MKCILIVIKGNFNYLFEFDRGDWDISGRAGIFLIKFWVVEFFIKFQNHGEPDSYGRFDISSSAAISLEFNPSLFIF